MITAQPVTSVDVPAIMESPATGHIAAMVTPPDNPKAPYQVSADLHPEPTAWHIPHIPDRPEGGHPVTDLQEGIGDILATDYFLLRDPPTPSSTIPVAERPTTERAGGPS
ncbi:hypothetical protein ACL02T_23470 [Pseudonocardia sp. RS010]|uniref:hypothetical protein n=1 Tax=Pseudonocardia sp. RS010 TaxID=3385979 RepID=UPI0039A10CB2